MMAYGPLLKADGLGDIPCGGSWPSPTGNNKVGIKFTAGHSGLMSGFRACVATNKAEGASGCPSGLTGGTGGTIVTELRADDGTGLPSTTVLASVIASNLRDPLLWDNTVALWLVSWPSQPSLVQGAIYHITYTNTDPNPTCNFVSPNFLWNAGAGHPIQPNYSDAELNVLLSVDDGAWQPSEQVFGDSRTPVLQIIYADGFKEARLPYISAWATDVMISGNSQLREVFTPPNMVIVNSLNVYAAWHSGSDPLVVSLTDSAGAVLASATFPAGGTTDKNVYYSAAMAPVTLLSGSQYYLVLSTASTSVWNALGFQKGYPTMTPETIGTFPEGHAEENPGTGWRLWGGAESDVDLQFYFT